MTDKVNCRMTNNLRGIDRHSFNSISWQLGEDRAQQDALIEVLSSSEHDVTTERKADMLNVSGFCDQSTLNNKQVDLHVIQHNVDLPVLNSEVDGKIKLTPDKTLKTNMKLINSSDIKVEHVDCSETKHCNDANPNSIVEINISANSQVKTNDCGKWQVEIINDHDDDDTDGISLDLCNDSTERNSEFGEIVYESECFDQRAVKSSWSGRCLSCPVHKDVETINSLGDHNLVLKHKNIRFDSFENGQLERCFVINDFHEDEKQEQSNLKKMSGHSEASIDACPKRTTSTEKRKLINPGQGVQLRVNVKKHAEHAEKAEIPTVPVSVKQSTIISSVKAVSVKSLVKKNDNIHAEYKRKDNNDFEAKIDSLYTQDSYLSGELNKEELMRVIRYEPPEIAKTGVIHGIGHLEFDLKKRDGEDKVEDRLKMENTRLSKLLIEVENARAATVNTLLQVNMILNRVQNDNTRLEGNLKTLSTEKTFMQEDLDKLKERYDKFDKENMDFIADTKATEFESSMKVILSSFKKEKRDLLNALSKSSTKLKNAEVDTQSLRVQFTKMKDQLENSNLTFNKLLEHNVKVSQQMETELKNLQEEKQFLLEKVKKSSESNETVTSLQEELASMKEKLERTIEEKDDLSRKVTHLEKSSKKSSQQCDELQDELDHSQDIMGKLLETEQNLKDRLQKEISEKTYLQDCLDETGQILLHLRGTEEKLRTEKDELEEDLEEEIQVNESLQQSLKTTIQEHQSLINRLQDMTQVHVTVKESLHEASKKEKLYEQQISNLQRTNEMLHFTLDKEKEEKMDLQEIVDNSECHLRIFKEEKISQVRDLEVRLQTLTEGEAALHSKVYNLEKVNEELRSNLEQEEEDNDNLRKNNARLQKYKDMTEAELEVLRKQQADNENEISDMKKRIDDLTKALKNEKTQYENLVCTLEDTEESLDKVTKEASLAHDEVMVKEKEVEELRNQLKEKCRKIHDIEIRIEEEVGEKERIQSRCKITEKEAKDLRKKMIEQQEEMEICQLHVKRLERENFTVKKTLEEKKKEFDVHKNKSAENLQRTKEELVGVQNRLVEKDMLVLKQKENFQDALENTTADLKLLRDFLGNNVDRVTDKESPLLRSVFKGENDKSDLEFLKNVNHKAEEELLKDVSHLEGMLKISKEERQTVTLLRSPLSKIKLSEIKILRNEMYELNIEVKKVRDKLANVCEELKKVTLNKRVGNCVVSKGSVSGIEEELRILDETLKNIENNHKYVIERNKGVINNGIVRVSRENSLDELDSTSDSSHEEEDKELARRDIINASLVAENKQLQKSIEIMQTRLGMSVDAKGIDAISHSSKEAARSLSRNDTTKVTNDVLGISTKISKKSSRNYLPPTSMRRSAFEKSTSEHYTSGYMSNDSIDGGKHSRFNMSATMQAPKKKGPSFFSAEMSMFHYDDGVASDILRKKLEKRITDNVSDTASVRSAGSMRGETTIRIRRSGSLDDDENDEDSDAPIGQFRRSRTLPRKFKSKYTK